MIEILFLKIILSLYFIAWFIAINPTIELRTFIINKLGNYINIFLLISLVAMVLTLLFLLV